MSDHTLLVEVEKREYLDPDPGYYQMDNEPRGYCVIINMTKKRDRTGTLVDDRLGAEIDEKNIAEIFPEYGFEVKRIIDKSHEDIQDALKRIARQISKSHQCLFLFLMAHGTVQEAGKRIRSVKGMQTLTKKTHLFQDINGHLKSSDYLAENFDASNCQNLAGKPKVFLIQTCFGSGDMIGPHQITKPTDSDGDIIGPHHILKPTESDTSPEEDVSDEMHTDETPAGHELPDPAHDTSDMLWARATLEDFASWRWKEGSYFLKALCNTLCSKTFKKSCLSKILTQVQREVSTTKINNKYRQQPEIIDHLNKTLMLNPGLNKTEAFSEPLLFPERPYIQKVEGTYTWQVKTDAKDNSKSPEYIVVNSDCPLMILYSEKYIKTFHPDRDFRKTTLGRLKGFKAGIAIDAKTHLVILKMIKGYKASLVDTDEQWKPRDTKFQIHSPLALCEVNNDGIGILCGSEEGYNKADFYVFSRKDILKECKPDKIEHFEFFYEVKAGDLVAYHRAKIYIASTFDSSVLVFNLASAEAEPITIIRYIDDLGNIYGYIDLPCMIGIDKRGVVVVHRLGINLLNTTHKNNTTSYTMEHLLVRQNIQHMWHNSKDVIVAQKRDTVENEKVNVLRSKPSFTKGVTRSYGDAYDAMWTTNDGGIILAENNSYRRVICIVQSDGNTQRKILPPEIDSINCGLATSSNEYVIITNQTEQSSIIWQVNTETDITCERDQIFHENNHPFKVFDVNQNSYGILRQQTIHMSAVIEIRNKQMHYQEKLLHVEHKTLTQTDAVCYTMNREFYITNCRKGNVLQYDVDGVFIRSFGTPGTLQRSNSIFVDRFDHLYVLCSDRMCSFDRSSGKWLQLNNQIIKTSMGCHDHQNLYLLQSDNKASVTTYDLHTEEEAKSESERNVENATKSNNGNKAESAIHSNVDTKAEDATQCNQETQKEDKTQSNGEKQAGAATNSNCEEQTTDATHTHNEKPEEDETQSNCEMKTKDTTQYNRKVKTTIQSNSKAKAWNGTQYDSEKKTEYTTQCTTERKEGDSTQSNSEDTAESAIQSKSEGQTGNWTQNNRDVKAENATQSNIEKKVVDATQCDIETQVNNRIHSNSDLEEEDVAPFNEERNIVDATQSNTENEKKEPAQSYGERHAKETTRSQSDKEMPAHVRVGLIYPLRVVPPTHEQTHMTKDGFVRVPNRKAKQQ